MRTSSNAGHQRRWANLLLTLVLAAIARVGVAAPVTWQSWTFDYDVSGDLDGLSLKNVTFQGRPLLTKLSFPVMRVFYDSDACGPYADRLGGTLSPIPWANNATLAQREFTLNGQQWYEIGIRDQIGSYDIYQVYYLSADGIVDAHVYSKGLQCVVNHIHYPNWRIDFGLDGAAGDQILRDRGAGFEVLPQEFDLNFASAAAWRVRDATTGLTVDVLPGFPDFVIPDGSTTVPVEVYSNNNVFGRAYRASEDTGWTYGPNTQVPFGNGEDITSADTVLWYEAYLPHSSSDGSALWHSTGVRLVTNLDGTAPPPPPPPPPPGQTQTFTGGGVAIPDYQRGAPYPSSINVAGVDGTITKVTVRLVGLTHTFPDDMDVLLVGPGGQTVMLMSDAGGGDDVSGVSLTFDSSSFVTLPDNAQLSGGLFRPVNYDAGDAFPAPAPAGTYGTTLDVFNGLAANGTWRLYVVDDATSDVGAIGSWELAITTPGTPPPPDTTPDAFAFTDVSGVAVSTLQVSNSVTITGINTATPISVTGGEYSIGCAVFTTAAGAISNGQTVCVRHTSAASNSTSTNTTLTVGGVADTFTSTTSATSPPPDTTPDAFAFTDVSGVALGTLQVSNTVTITGINTPAPISVTGGEYAIGCGAAFTTAAGTISNGQTVCVRHTSAATNATSTNTTLTVGGVGDTFTSTTALSGSGQTQSFAGGAVAIPDYQPGSPYPSSVNVAGMGGTISKVTVRLDGLTHTYPDDTDVLLVGPGGQTVMLMSDAGGGGHISNLSLTFDSAAVGTLPDNAQLSGGTYRPVNYGAGDPFPAPAPAGSYGTTLDVFNGLAANGTWRLYVVDDQAADVGTIGSWTLTITTTSTTPPPDTTPDAFAFTDVSGVAVSTLQVSNSVTITGINTATPISVTGGEYSIGCAVFTTAAGAISNGQTVCVRHTSAASNSTSTNTTLTVGGVADTFTSTTSATSPPPDTTPDAFAFTDVSGVALGALQVSNTVTITGINTPAPISVTGGEYAIGCGAAFTTAAGTISNGQTVCVRHTSAATNATSTNTTLTVGGVGDTFTSTTALSGSGQTQSFAGGAVAIPDYQPGSPYPSSVNVAGMGGTISKVTVRLDGLTHTYPDDTDVLLVGPGGQTVMLMSDAGGGGHISNLSLTFDSAAVGTLPDNAQLSGGTYRPVNYGAGDPFPAPAPAGSYGTTLDVFNGLAANGTWRLYVVDDQATDIGTIGSWTLTVTTQ